LVSEAEANGKTILVGSENLLLKENVFLKSIPENGYGSAVHVAIDGVHRGYIVIADELKKDAAYAIRKLKQLGVKRTIMLSGDRNDVAQQAGRELGVDYMYRRTPSRRESSKAGGV
jgi:Zn2+/Cd2+-exporting ATPase